MLRWPLADLAAALTFGSGALGKLAVDVLTLSRTEIGELAEPGGAGVGASSAMPHKRNPVLGHHDPVGRTAGAGARSRVEPVHGWPRTSVPSAAGRLSGCCCASACGLIGGAGHTAVQLCRGLTVYPQRMLDNLNRTGALLVTERLVAATAPRLGKSTARQVVTDCLNLAQSTGRPPHDVLRRDPTLSSVLTGPELDQLLDASSYLGAAGDLVDRGLRRRAESPPTLGELT